MYVYYNYQSALETSLLIVIGNGIQLLFIANNYIMSCGKRWECLLQCEVGGGAGIVGS